ncbi:MAG: DoxX family membrane protein, partial [Pedobacter sp.]|nr:DoxX family membrane protein [Pedobacter sp.]
MILTSLQLIVGFFFSILFLQSGFDKVFDYAGNKGYIKSVFEPTFLKGASTLLFIAIVLLEVAAGLLSAIGTVYYFFTHESALLVLGLQLSALSLLGL